MASKEVSKTLKNREIAVRMLQLKNNGKTGVEICKILFEEMGFGTLQGTPHNGSRVTEYLKVFFPEVVKTRHPIRNTHDNISSQKKLNILREVLNSNLKDKEALMQLVLEM